MLEQQADGHFRLQGSIDMQDSSLLLKELLALPQTTRDSCLFLDVSALVSADSLLLAAVLDIRRQLLSQGRTLRIAGLPDSMRGLARTYGIESLLTDLIEVAA